VFLDALVLKIREGGSVQRRACYLAMAIGMDGEREVLGMWLQANEGAKFWMQVLTDLEQRGVQDIVIACVDGLKGFPEAIEAVFPATGNLFAPASRRHSQDFERGPALTGPCSVDTSAGGRALPACHDYRSTHRS
jgi:hypothetical protein